MTCTAHTVDTFSQPNGKLARRLDLEDGDDNSNFHGNFTTDDYFGITSSTTIAPSQACNAFADR